MTAIAGSVHACLIYTLVCLVATGLDGHPMALGAWGLPHCALHEYVYCMSIPPSKKCMIEAKIRK